MCPGRGKNRKARGKASRKTCLPTAAGSLGENRARVTKAARLRSWAQAGEEDRKMVAGAFWFRQAACWCQNYLHPTAGPGNCRAEPSPSNLLA